MFVSWVRVDKDGGCGTRSMGRTVVVAAFARNAPSDVQTPRTASKPCLEEGTAGWSFNAPLVQTHPITTNEESQS